MLIDHETIVKVDRADFKRERKELQYKLGALQRQCRAQGIPVIIVVAGPNASGKGKVVGEMLSALDPRGFKLHTVPSPPTDDHRYPYMTRYWKHLPARDGIGVFINNWYRPLFHRVKGFKSKQDQVDWCRRLDTFEEQLTDSGYRIIKFYLHISRRVQKKRLEKLASNKDTAWRVTANDLRMMKKYDQYLGNANRVVKATTTKGRPWVILPADSARGASLFMLRALVTDLERTVAEGLPAVIGVQERTIEAPSVPSPRLEDVDLSLSLNREDYDKRLDRLQKRLMRLQSRIYRKKIPVAIVYEGWDAAGKGGNIKRVARGLDPRGYDVIPIGAPTSSEKRHHYLWRFWKQVPRTGHIALFDRSWYGRVLVEKVEGFCSPEECERAYAEISHMEHEWTRSGMVLLKFWIHINQAEQLRRFKERQKIPHKQWKITDDDWRNREKWDEYVAAVNTMLARTHSDRAPWTIIESNCKRYARIKVLTTVVDALEARLR